MNPLTSIYEEFQPKLYSFFYMNTDNKEIVLLRIYGELSFKEIGDTLNKSENYARVTFHRGKIKIQKELERYNEN